MGLVLDGVAYHRINSQDVPPGFVSVPLLVDDNGTEYNTKLIAGSVGYAVSSSSNNPNYLNSNATRTDTPQPTLSEIDAQAGEMDSLQPCIGWWCFISKSDEEIEKAVVEKYRAWGFEGPGDEWLARG